MADDVPSESRAPGRRPLDLLPSGLAALARRAVGDTPAEASARAVQTERVLRSSVEALLALASRTPGFDVTVTVNAPGGHDPGAAVRIRYTHEGLVAHRLTARGKAAAREEVGSVYDESEVASELASMLWSGEVEPR